MGDLEQSEIGEGTKFSGELDQKIQEALKEIQKAFNNDLPQ